MAIGLTELPESNLVTSEIVNELACKFLRHLDTYTKNYHTGVHLCQPL